MDDAKPNTFTVEEAQLRAELRSGANACAAHVRGLLARGVTAAVQGTDGSLTYFSDPAAFEQWLAALE